MARRLIPFLAVTFAPSVAMAVPAPMTENDLIAQSMLVIDAESVALDCVGAPVDDGKSIETRYRAGLRVSNVIKGTPDTPMKIDGWTKEWTDRNAMPTGAGPTPPLPIGWRGRLYLQKLSTGFWVPTFWNGVVEDSTNSHPGALPACGALPRSKPSRGCASCACSTRAENADTSGVVFSIALVLLLTIRIGSRRGRGSTPNRAEHR